MDEYQIDNQMDKYMEAQDMLAEMRNSRRKISRISYDCMHLKVSQDRAKCSKGKALTTAKDRSLAMDSVLKGYTPKVCFTCPEFIGDCEEE